MKKNKYDVIETDGAALRNFKRDLDSKNNAILTWDWPQNRNMKLLFVFEWTDSEQDVPALETLIGDDFPHDVVTRELAAKYTKCVSDKSKFILATAFFNEDKGITICKPVLETDWFFKKVSLTTKTERKPLPLSNYDKVTIRVISDDPSQADLVTQILRYAVFEQGQKIGEYPLDNLSCAGACGFYLKKEQSVKFILDENYHHLFNINGG
jgi:hypothetical protein